MRQSYQDIVSKNSPKENVFINAIIAFISGGVMGVIGQFLIDGYTVWFDISTKEATVCMLVTLIFLSCLFTSLGFFDKLVNFCKCGLIIPITGFAHAMMSAALESSRDKAYDEQVRTIVGAAETYMSENSKKLPSMTNGSSCCLNVDTLQKAGLLKSDDIKNPKYKKDSNEPLEMHENFDGSVVITFTNKYEYKYMAATCTNEC